MARPDKWMPMYWADFWKDTAHLSEAEGWAYINLIGAYWTNAGPLPMDNARLQRLSRCSPKIWEKVKATVIGFFHRDNDCYRHGRIDRELIKTTEAYTKRKAHMDAVNKKKKQSQAQSPPTVTVDNDRQQSPSRNLQPQSPNGETTSNDVVARKPRRSITMPPDWMPSQKDSAYASAKGLDAKTISNIGQQCRDHHIGKGTPIKDLSAIWRTWVANHLNYHGTGPWPRPDGGQSPRNQTGRGSLAAAHDSILAKAGVPRGQVENLCADGSARPERTQDSWGNSGPIIDADHWERSPGTSDGIKGTDAPDSGPDDSGHGNPTGGLPEACGELSGGRGAACLEDPSGGERLVASLAGDSGTLGDSHLPQTDDDDSLEIPAFLKREVAA